MDENRKPSDVQEEFDKLYLEYRPRLIRLVMPVIKDPYLAEDVVQEIFYEAWRHYETFDGHPNKKGWLYLTARYKIGEFLRKVMQGDRCSLNLDDLEISAEESGFSKAEMELMIYETLTPDELLRFRRYFLWGESTAEIAEKENVTENNMRVRISRLKKKIENALRKK